VDCFKALILKFLWYIRRTYRKQYYYYY